MTIKSIFKELYKAYRNPNARVKVRWGKVIIKTKYTPAYGNTSIPLLRIMRWW